MLARGQLVLVAFPFTDLTATKVRPTLVVSPPPLERATRDVLLAAVSSVVPRTLRPCDVLVAADDADFAASGLLRSSVVLCGKLFTMQARLVLRSLGRLERRTMAKIDAALGAALGLDRWR